MNEKEARRVFDHYVALSKILGGDLKTRCLGKGMTEQQFDTLLREQQRLSNFIDKHDSEGNIKVDEKIS
jgi:hypothetical protein